MALIPFVGLALQNFAESGDKVIEKFAAKRQNLIDQLRANEITKFLGDIINNYTLDPMDDGSGDLAKAEDLKSKFNQGISNIQSKVQDLHGKLSTEEGRKALQEEVQGKYSKLKEKAQQKLEELKSHPEIQSIKENLQSNINKIKENPQLSNITQNVKNQIQKIKEYTKPKKAGKRLSNKKHHKNKKWKTQRKILNK
jgi:hypothetical protein